MVDFAGWSMPVQYAGVLKEHEVVRSSVGVFDVGHMGELFLRGAGAEATLDLLATNNVARLQDGQAQYTALCNEDGGVRDDVLVYRLARDHFMMVVNASNTAKIRDWTREHLQPQTELQDRTAEVSLLAVQGPRSRELLQGLDVVQELAPQMAELPYYRFAVAGKGPGAGGWLLSRTGYTGELGYEIYCDAARARECWDALLAGAQGLQAAPIGLAARDTLRFEVGFCLYGHELEEDISPLEAGIGWTVKLKKETFVGREALVRQKAAGIPRQLVGLELQGRAIARQGFDVLADDRVIGKVTSGTFAPTLQKSLALALVERGAADGAVAIRVRGKAVAAHKVALPFHRTQS
jgi:aminomethyltransferase